MKTMQAIMYWNCQNKKTNLVKITICLLLQKTVYSVKFI